MCRQQHSNRMAVKLFLILFICFVGVAFGDFIKAADQTQGKPWPLPKSMNQTSDILILDKNHFDFHVIGHTCDLLQEALKRYHGIVFDGVSDYMLWYSDKCALSKLDIDMKDVCEDYPHFNMDESYDLTVSQEKSVLCASSIWGILRGLETFSQLVHEGESAPYQIQVSTISDAPRFSHRGVLLDTSRHYLPIKVIKQNLDAMAYNKMNVFHWHIVDQQSFPYQSERFPDLSNKGAYQPYTHIYTPSQVAEVIEYARQRGIRVVPEFDTPGHTLSWGKGQPDLLTPCYKDGKPSGDYGPINPALNSTFSFLSELVKEISKVFPDDYVHLGGDEVPFSCWKSNPDVNAFMTKMGFPGNYAMLEQYYMQTLLDIVESYNSKYVIWQEVIDNGCKVSPNTVVEVWKGGQQAELAKVTKMGYHAILSSCWYLNRIAYGTDWLNFYKCDPHDFNGTAAQKELVIGGEMCMWGEWVDGTNLIPRLWPRGCAVAERLWSPAETTKSSSAATPRMKEHRCRMVRRGLNAEPINGPSWCPYEYSP